MMNLSPTEATMTYDAVNQPSHYTEGRWFETIEVIEDWDLNFRLGNALKYLSRTGRKDPSKAVEDLRKCIWYVEREIAALETEKDLHESKGDELYDDILVYYGQTQDEKEAWPTTDDTIFGNDTFAVFGGSDVPFDATSDDWISFWEDDKYDLHVTDTSVFLNGKEDFLWDPSLGPVELTRKDIDSALERKDLQQFTPDEIVSTIEKRGFILGVKKDGSTCVLKDGRCE